MNQTLSKKLYVGSLPYSVSEEDLKELFTPYGEVESARVIIDKATGQSKGFGFVEMADLEAAAQAIEALHGSQIGGRTLIVNHARPEVPREQRSPRRYDDRERRDRY